MPWSRRRGMRLASIMWWTRRTSPSEQEAVTTAPESHSGSGAVSVLTPAEEWPPFGFDDEAAAAWRPRGFGALEAALARDDGYTPFNARRDPKGTARFRQRWAARGLAPPEARRWHQWNFAAAEAARWSRAGLDLASASMWRTMGFLPDEAARPEKERHTRTARS
jgi:hypothetical protein